MHRVFLFSCLALALISARTVSSAEPVWNLERLSSAPGFKWVDAASPVRSLIYQSEPFEGHPTDVFAYYATPGSVSGDASLDRNLPAVVLIHGGGGTAFPEWVWLWAKRGYAALAMDLSGRRPEAPTYQAGSNELIVRHIVPRERLPLGGPEHGAAEKFGSIGGSIDDDWPYHAVSSVIRAHSLIRSFKEVDADRTAVTGISWGGYTTCLVASVDSRFKAAVPVYGCGFLFDGESVQKPLIDALDPERRAEWIRRYDPSSHLANCRVPILFVNGTSDQHYPLNSYTRCFQLVPGEKQIRIEVQMRHSHVAGWEPIEIGRFIDERLTDGAALPKLGVPKLAGEQVTAACDVVEPLQKAELHFTTDSGRLVDRKWQTQPARFAAGLISAPSPPAGTTIWYLSATDSRSAMLSTDVVFEPAK